MFDRLFKAKSKVETYRVLIVDTNLDQARQVRDLLRKAGFSAEVFITDLDGTYSLDGLWEDLSSSRYDLFLYNQTWARELGFDSPPQTSFDFDEQACAANKKLAKDSDDNNNALGGWLIDANAMTPLSWMLAFDGGLQEQDGYRFLAPGDIDAFRFLKTLQQKSCAWVASPDVPVYDRFVLRQALFATASLEEFPDQARAFSAAGNSDS